MPFIALVQIGLPSSCAILRLRRKRVSVKLVHVDFLDFCFVFYKSFPLAGMTTKFNQDMYTKMRSKKNESLSNLGKRIVHVTGKGPHVTPIVPGTEKTRTASLATSVEEIATPISKRPRLTNKGKEKADSCSSNIWDNEELAVERAHVVVTFEDLKVFLGMPSNKVVACHVHTCSGNVLVQL